MTNVYVVVENGELYPDLYGSYISAREAVITKYNAELRLERDEVEEMDDPDYKMASDVDVDENETGTTQLYIEKGINIIIQRYDCKKIKKDIPVLTYKGNGAVR
jgi:hypothetical protein